MIMRKICTLVLFVSALLTGIYTQAQVTTNGGSGLAASYTSLDLAITALNAASITSPVVINVTANETSPVAGYVITAQGSSTNTITINGGGFTITGNNGLTAGAYNDAIFKLRGADWVTLQGFNIVNNGNTANGTGAGVNTRYEFGIALFPASTTNGAQNNTIQNNTTNMAGAGGVYPNTFAIFSTSTALESLASNTPTASSGTNSNNKYYSNTITNTHHGIVALANPASSAAVEELGLEIGGAGLGNNITFGQVTTFGTANMPASVGQLLQTPNTGIQVRGPNNGFIANNTISLGTDNTLASTGILYHHTSTATLSTQQTLAGSRTVVSNTISMVFNTITNSAQTGIDMGSTAVSAAAAAGTLVDVAVRDNSVTMRFNAASGALSGALIGIRAGAVGQNRLINANTVSVGMLSSSLMTSGSSFDGINVVSGTTATGVLQCDSNIINSGPAATYELRVSILSNGINIGTARASSASFNNNSITFVRNLGNAPTVGINSSSAAVTEPQNFLRNNISMSGTLSVSIGTLEGIRQTSLGTSKTISNNVISILLPSAIITTQTAGINSQGGRSIIENNQITINHGGGSIATAVACGLRLGGSTAGTLASELRGNTIDYTCSVATPTIVQSHSGIFIEGSNYPAIVENNTIQSMAITNTATSTNIDVAGIRSSWSAITPNNNLTLTIRNNQIANISTATNAGTATINGVLIASSSSATTGTQIFVRENRIADLINRHGSPVSAIRGIRLLNTGTAVVNVFNNRIALLGDIMPNTPGALQGVQGISDSASAAATYNVLFNSVRVGVTSAQTNFNSSAYFHTASATAANGLLILRNNLLENTSTTGSAAGVTAAIRFSGTALANYDAASNNNLYFVSSPSASAPIRPLFSDGTTNAITIGTMPPVITAPIRDNNSRTDAAPAPYLSTAIANSGFMLMDVNGSTNASDGGIAIGAPYDVDVDGNPATRSGTTPDIGADEFTLLCPRPGSPPSISLTNTGSGQITINFGASSPAPTGGYIIVRNTSGVAPTVTDGVFTLGGGGGTIVSTQATNAAFIDGGLTNGTLYYYYIFAYNAGGCAGTAWWNTTPRSGSLTALAPCATPGNPGALTTSNFTTASIDVSWGAASPVPSSYLVIRSIGAPTGLPPVNGTTYTVGSSAFGGVIEYIGTATSYVSSGLAANTTYTYTVYSLNTGCGGAPVYSVFGSSATGATTTCLAPGTYSIGPAPSNYTSITQVVSLLSTCTLTGNYFFQLKSDYSSSVETFPINIPLFTGSSSTARVVFRPAPGATNLQISSSFAGSLINFNAARFVEFDGRPGGTGASLQLTLMNTNNTVAAPAVSFTNEASDNVLQHLNIRSANVSATSATIVLGATSTNGHRNITISNNHIFDATTGTPANGIGSFATTTIAARYNQNISITNNQIYNFYSSSLSTSGIFIDDGASAWTITGNSFYQTTSRSLGGSATFSFIQVDGGLFVEGLTINNNFFGGTAVSGGGGLMTLSNGILRGVLLSVGNGSTTTFNGNTFRLISFSSSTSSALHSLLNIADGTVQVGTGGANTFGQSFITASIAVDLVGATSTSSFSAILAGTGTSPGAGPVSIENNNFFGISLAGTTAGQAMLNVIQLTGNSGQFTVQNNTLGSATTANSINATSNNSLRGIFSTATRTSGAQIINGNTLVNFTHNGTGTNARVAGIFVDVTAAGVHQITGNNVSNISGASATTSFIVASGIVSQNTSPNQVISGNQVFNISSSTGTSAAVSAAGIVVNEPASGGSHTVERNRVHSINVTTTNTGAAIYGIIINSGTSMVVRNNFVRLGITGAGANITNAINVIGIQEGTNVSNLSTLYNTVYIGGTGVTIGGGASYAYLSLATGGTRTIQNNIFYNARSASGTGALVHQAIQITTATGLTANRNVYAAIGTNNLFARINTTNHTTLASWRTATGQDANSFSSYLSFVNATGNAAAVDLHINPTVETIVEGNGAGIATVNNDIDNDTRSTTATPPTGTDIGADEGTFTAVAAANQFDVAVDAVVSPDVSGCFTASTPVTLTLRNTRATAIPAGFPIQLEVVITGPTATTLTLTYTGGIAASSTVNVTLGNADMSALGTYNVRAACNVDLNPRETDITNDVLLVSRVRTAPTVGTVTVTPDLFCVTGGSVTATTTGNSGGTVQWQTSIDGTSWTNVGTVNSSTYTVSITQTTFFRVRLSCGGSDLFSVSDTVTVGNPVLTSTTGATKCGPGAATISAVTPTPGAAVNWFLAPTGGGIAGSGSSFSPFVNSTITYYAAAEIPIPGVNTGIFGTSTNVNTQAAFSSTDYPSPYTNWYGGNKHQMMIRASELTAAGFSAGNITSLSFTMTAIGATLATTPVLQNFTIGMKATSAAALGSTFETGFITVLAPTSVTLPTSGLPADVTHTFTTPFYWDGVSNVVIQTAYTNGNLGTSSTFVQMRHSDPGFQSTLVFRKDSDGNINNFLNETNPTYVYTNRRPNMRLTISNSCSSPRVPVTITYTAPPALAITPTSASICNGSSTTVSVTPATVGNYTNYTWTPVAGATPGGTPSGSTVSLAPTATTRYVLQASNGAGCTNSDSLLVTVIPTPSTLAGTGYAICANATVPGGQGLSGSGSNPLTNIAGSVVSGPTYVRSNGGATYIASGTNTYYSTFLFTVNTTGTYTLNGCATSTYTDMHASIYQTSFNPLAPATNFLLANDDGNGANCGLGSRLTLTLTAGVNYVLVTGTFGDTRTLDFDWTYSGPGQLLAAFPSSVYYWYAAPTGGTALATGTNVFNPVGVAGSGLSNTATPGTYTYYLANNSGTCESPRVPVDFVINAASSVPTAILANGVNPLVTCGGANNITLTQTGGVLGGGATWQWSTDPTFTTTIGSSTLTNAELIRTQPSGTTSTYYLRAAGAVCGPANLASGLSVAVTVNPNGTWIGTNTNWTDPANWCGGIPTSTTNVAVPNYGPGGNYPIIATGVTANVANITLNVNSRMVIQPNAGLNIGGTMINDGNIINRGTITLNGTGAQTFPGTGLGQVGYLNELVIDKSAGNTTLNRSFAVNGALIPTRGNIQVDSLITIRSTNDTTARVGIFGAGVNLTYGTAGRFSIERYIPAKRAWRLLTSPTTAATGQTINAAWQEGVTAWPMGPATGLTNPSPGYGTHISGGTQANGYDQNVNGNASIRVFGSGWQNLSVATSLLSRRVTDERAYMVFVRGSRGLNMSEGQFAIPDVTTLRSSGRINVANATPFTVTSSGLTLAGNPFPSAISFRQLATDNGFLNDPARNVFYLWDPTLAGNRNVGAFVTVAYNLGTGNYDRSVTASGANYTTAGGNQGIDNQGTIQSGLGFFMNFGGTSNTVNFNEGIKVAGSSSAVFRPGPQIRTTLRTRMADGSTPINDGVLVNFHPIFSNDADDNDVKKVDNFTENLSLWRSGTLFSIERRKPPVAGDTLHFRLRNLVINNFQFEFAPDSLIYPQLQAFLIDRHLGTETPISLKDTTRYNFTIAANPASIWAEDRFALVFKPNVGSSVIPVTITSIRAARRDQHINVDWNVENEINIRHYTVERSSDGRNFSDLGQVQASGRLSSAYAWLDQQPFSGDNFYRIRYTNADGSVGYSRIVKVDAGKIGRAIVVYPNPVTDGIIGTEFRNMPAGVYQARLVNGAGQTIFIKNITHPGGTALLQIQPDYFLVPGSYQLEITGSDKSQQTIQVLVK